MRHCFLQNSFVDIGHAHAICVCKGSLARFTLLSGRAGRCPAGKAFWGMNYRYSLLIICLADIFGKSGGEHEQPRRR